MSPLCQTHVRPEQLQDMEPFYPLHAYVCGECFLVQLQEFVTPAEIFTEYAYFSSYSTSWVDHARRYSEMMIQRLNLGPASKVMEVASNDGYLLQHFVARGVPVLGIEPAANVAKAAVERASPLSFDSWVGRAPRRSSPSMVVRIWSSATTCSLTSQTSTTSWMG